LKHSPSLFQHIGEHSSLRGKLQNLFDKNFRDRLIYENHTNPDAILKSSLKTFEDYTLDGCYKKGKHYWAYNPNENDYIHFNFKEPFLLKKLDFFLVLVFIQIFMYKILILSRFYIKSGNMDHPGDKIPANSTIEIKTLNLTRDNELYFEIGRFDINGVAQGQVNYTELGTVQHVQINISKRVDNWIVINEIVFA
jgi:alpha-1,3-mannosylglycoprotein beta-1,4-N-acetylglucosaminyltransferase A/B